MITAKMVQELREATGAGIMDCKAALNENNGDFDKALDYLREKGIAKAAKKASRIAAEGLANVKSGESRGVVLEVNSETDFVAKNEEFKNFVASLTDAIVESDVTTMEEANALEFNGSTVADTLTSLTAKIGEKLSFRRFVAIDKKDDEVFGAYSHMGGKIVTLVLLKGADEDVARDVAMHVAAMNPKYITREEVPSDEIEHERSVLTEQTLNEGKPADKVPMIVEGKVNKYLKEICLVDQEYVKDPSMKVSDLLSSKGAKVTEFARIEKGEGLEKKEENFAEEVAKQING